MVRGEYDGEEVKIGNEEDRVLGFIARLFKAEELIVVRVQEQSQELVKFCVIDSLFNVRSPLQQFPHLKL